MHTIFMMFVCFFPHVRILYRNHLILLKFFMISPSLCHLGPYFYCHFSVPTRSISIYQISFSISLFLNVFIEVQFPLRYAHLMFHSSYCLQWHDIQLFWPIEAYGVYQKQLIYLWWWLQHLACDFN